MTTERLCVPVYVLGEAARAHKTEQRTKTHPSPDRNPVASAVRAFRRGSPFCVALASKLPIRKGCDARLHVSRAARSRKAQLG
jgi:hypothetical protein